LARCDRDAVDDVVDVADDDGVDDEREDRRMPGPTRLITGLPTAGAPLLPSPAPAPVKVVRAILAGPRSSSQTVEVAR
jgi:hypothetical protein